jgi:hypothetical protein
MRDVLGKRRLRGYELREIVTALGESRSDAAVDLLYELASDAPTFEQCEDDFINAFAALDTPRARELLMGFVDPDIRGIWEVGTGARLGDSARAGADGRSPHGLG